MDSELFTYLWTSLKWSNSKGDYLAIAGSTKIHQWVDEEHILIPPDMVLGGNLTSRPFFLQVSRFCFWVGVYPGMTDEMIGFMIEKIRKVAERFEVRGLGGEVRG